MKPIDIYYKMPYIVRYPIFMITGAYQAHYRYGRNFRCYLQELMGNLTMSKDEIQMMQISRMKELILHSYEHVPYYHRIFKQIDFHPFDFKNMDDILNIPILTKDIIRNNFNDLIADNFPKSQRTIHHSGGTTGEPLNFYLPKNLKGPFNFATLYRFYYWAGVSFRDRRVSISGRLTTKRPPFAMYNPSENQLYVSAHHLSDNNLEDITNSILKFHPSFVQGHPSAVTVFAKYLQDCNITIPVKSVFTTSENLHNDQREIIEKAFQSKVFDTYGMGEMVASASECSEHNGYHISPEYGYMEVINQDSYGDGIGEIVSTSLQNYAMPFIRYKCGDIGKPSTRNCSCGCNFPMLEELSGRIDDVIITSKGEHILPLKIRIQMKNAGFSDFQLVQRNSLEYELRFFESPEACEKEKIVSQARFVLGQILGNNCIIRISFDCLPIKTNMGKQQMIISWKQHPN